MSMVQIVSRQFDVVVTMSVKGGYNPDALDDVKRRALDAYKEAVAFNVSITEQITGEEVPE